LLEITDRNPELKLINSGFEREQSQAKFTMNSPEGAEALMKKFEGRKFEVQDNF
jgi:hypothetical protein